MHEITLPWMDGSLVRETILNTHPDLITSKMRVRPDLVYLKGANPTQEILDELDPGEGVAVVLETRESSKKVQDLEEKVRTYEEKIRTYLDNIVTSLSGRTSKFTKCPACGSNVSIPHIKSPNCPVCGSGELLMTATHQAKIEGYRKYINDYQGRLVEAIQTQRTQVIAKEWLVVCK